VFVVRAAGDEASTSLAAGQATILQMEPFAEAENKSLAHSRLYQSEPVISKIVTLICGSPPAKAPVEPPGSLEDRTRSAGQSGAP
jgi:hypothetical protein